MTRGDLTVRDGLCDKFLRLLYRAREAQSTRQAGRNRGRAGAARPMRLDSAHERGLEEQLISAVVKDIDRLSQSAQVAAFD